MTRNGLDERTARGIEFNLYFYVFSFIFAFLIACVDFFRLNELFYVLFEIAICFLALSIMCLGISVFNIFKNKYVTQTNKVLSAVLPILYLVLVIVIEVPYHYFLENSVNPLILLLFMIFPIISYILTIRSFEKSSNAKIKFSKLPINNENFTFSFDSKKVIIENNKIKNKKLLILNFVIYILLYLQIINLIGSSFTYLFSITYFTSGVNFNRVIIYLIVSIVEFVFFLILYFYIASKTKTLGKKGILTLLGMLVFALCFAVVSFLFFKDANLIPNEQKGIIVYALITVAPIFIIPLFLSIVLFNDLSFLKKIEKTNKSISSEAINDKEL